MATVVTRQQALLQRHDTIQPLWPPVVDLRGDELAEEFN
jgi:hypothetical protein